MICSALRLLAPLVILAFLVGCEHPNSSSFQTTEPTALLPVSTASSGGDGDPSPEISESEADAFAIQLATSMSNNEATELAALVDFAAICDRATEGLGSMKLQRDFTAGAVTISQDLANTISQQVTQGGSYRHVRNVQRGPNRHVVMRLMTSEGTTNYHDLRLHRKDGRVVADQLFIASTGESFSDTLRALAATSLISQGSVVDRLSGKAKQDLDALLKQAKLAVFVRQGKYAEAIAAYETLPTELQQQKLPKLYRVMALAFDEDEQKYLEALDDFAQSFPGDACLGLITIDAAVLRKDDDMLVKAYDMVMQWTGGDPMLTLMIASNRAIMGNGDAAARMVEGIDVAAIKLPDAHDYMMTLALYREDFEVVLEHLRYLRDDYGYQFGNLADSEPFEEFAASPQYQQFLAD